MKRNWPGAAKQGDPLPPEWNKVSAEETERHQRVLAQVIEALPGRGIVLLSAPPGTSLQDVAAVACVTNIGRPAVAELFSSMLDWWGSTVAITQPDRHAAAALREGVATLQSIPLSEIIGEMPKSLGRILDAMNKGAAAGKRVRTEGATRDPGEAAALRATIIQNALQLAVEALSIFNRLNPTTPEVETEPHASGAPPAQPMPPPQAWPRGDTKTTLVADLLERPQSEDRDQIIEMARRGDFHDYESDSAAPKGVLIDILARFGFPDLAGKARDGGYDDEHPTVEQEEEMRHGVGPETYDALIPKERGQA